MIRRKHLEASVRIETIIALVYLIVIYIVKSTILDKKFDKKKNDNIFNALSALLIPYFLILKQFSLAAIVLVVLIWQNFINKKKKTNK